MMNKVKELIQLENMIRIWNHPYMIFFMISFFTFARALSYGPFIFDDGVQIFNNPFMADSPLYYLTNSLTPIPFLVWRFIITLFGTDQTYPFRLLNIGVHAFNGYMVWMISHHFLIKDKSSRFLSFIVAILFLLHPTQVEPVVWVSALRTLLGGSFSLLGLYYFLTYTQSTGPKATSDLILSYIATFCTIFTYPPMISMVLTYPFFMAIRGDQLKDLLLLRKDKNFLFSSIILVIFLALTFFMHKSNTLSQSFGIVSVRNYLELIFSSLGQYTINTALPFQLYFDYQINPLTLNYLRDDFQTNLSFYTGLMTILIFLAFVANKKTRLFSSLLLCYILFLSPNLGIIHHDFHNMSTVSDRYLYLSLFPFALGLVFALTYIKKIHSHSITIFIILLFTILSIRQVGLWKDTKSFLERSTPKAQLSAPLLTSLAYLYRDQGKLNQSAALFMEVLATDPYNLSAFDGLIDIFFNDPNQKSAERVVALLERRIITPTENQFLAVAKIYYFLKDFDKAREFANQSLMANIRPEQSSEIIKSSANSKRQVLRDHLEKLFNIYYSTNQINLAKQLNDELLKLYPHNKDYLDKRDLILKELATH